MSEPKLRRYKYLWAKCQNRDVILAAWRKLRKGKTKRKEVQIIEADFDHYVDLMIETLKETRPGGDPEKKFTPSFKTGRSYMSTARNAGSTARVSGNSGCIT